MQIIRWTFFFQTAYRNFVFTTFSNLHLPKYECTWYINSMQWNEVNMWEIHTFQWESSEFLFASDSLTFLVHFKCAWSACHFAMLSVSPCNKSYLQYSTLYCLNYFFRRFSGHSLRYRLFSSTDSQKRRSWEIFWWSLLKLKSKFWLNLPYMAR